MIRIFGSAAVSGHAHQTIAASTRTYRRNACLFPIALLLSILSLLSCLSEHEGLQNLPLGVVLRIPVLAAVMEEISARLFGQGMNEQPALGVAGNGDAPDGLEVLAR